MSPRFDVVVPTIGRPSLLRMLALLVIGEGPAPGRIIVVDDRPASAREPLDLPISGVVVVRGRGAGPAAARNLGWRASDAEWIAFLDDDVEPEDDWRARLALDLEEAGADVGGCQGNIDVPLPSHRPPTDWERNVAGLATARWATADMAYRRRALEDVGGFDERFPQAHREDADLSLRVMRAGYRLVRGRRRIKHPVRTEDRWVSVRVQRRNADDALMRAVHGPGWREAAGVPSGRRARHVAITLATIGAAAALARGKLGTGFLCGLAALGGVLEFAWARIAPGPRSPGEMATMWLTSAVIPFAATYHFARGWARAVTLFAGKSAGERAWTAVKKGAEARGGRRPRPRAVLFDRDGTLVHDVPYNGDPALVVAVPGAREALDRLRAAGIALAVVSDQSGVGRGILREEQARAVGARVEELLGPVGPWLVCLHSENAGCACRRPAPALVVSAASALGVSPGECAMIGDTGADVGAALAAGARAILVPNARTRREEIDGAPEVARDLGAAVDLLLGGRA